MGFKAFFLLFVLGAPAFAAGPLDSVAIKDHKNVAVSEEDWELISAFREKLDEASALTAKFPEQGSHLKLIDLNSNIKSQYYEGRISLQTACQKNTRLPSLSYLPVLLHEYGHVVFEINLEHFLLKEKTESALYADKFDDGEKSFNYNVPIGIVDLAAPFNEFFADVYAVLILDNPQAMSDFFRDCSGLERHRDFTWNYAVDPARPVSDLTSIFTDVHLTLDPARSYVWKRYQSMSADSQARAHILEAALFAAKDAIAELYRGGALYSDWAHVDVAKLNSDLVRRIEENLAAKE